MFTGLPCAFVFALLIFQKIFPRFSGNFCRFQIVKKAARRMRPISLLKSRPDDEIKAGRHNEMSSTGKGANADVFHGKMRASVRAICQRSKPVPPSTSFGQSPHLSDALPVFTATEISAGVMIFNLPAHSQKTTA